jgi:2-keto-3-deoxy-L-rhamnonate aldolase RhmA
VNTVADAKHIMSATKYGAKCGGTRSSPPYRLSLGISDTPIDKAKSLHENQNDQAAVVIQIESLEGLNNLDEILTQVPEIDAVWLGNIDCRVSMGLRWEAGVVPNEPEWQDTVARFKQIMKKHNKPSGGFALGPPEKMRMMGEGKAMVFVAVDTVALLGMVDELKKARQVFSHAN